VWQDQVIFFNMTHAALKFNPETGEGFSISFGPDDNGRKCNQWNMLCTTKLKDVVALAWTAFKRQSTKEGELLKDSPFKE